MNPLSAKHYNNRFQYSINKSERPRTRRVKMAAVMTSWVCSAKANDSNCLLSSEQILLFSLRRSIVTRRVQVASTFCQGTKN